MHQGKVTLSLAFRISSDKKKTLKPNHPWVCTRCWNASM